MIFSENYFRLTAFIVIFCVEASQGFEVGLDPFIKSFILVTSILGPLSILGVVLILKKIENENPDRIRWK